MTQMRQTSNACLTFEIAAYLSCLFFGVAHSFGQDGASAAMPKSPVPAAKEIRAAESSINEVFKEEMNLAKRPKAIAEKKDLATKLQAAAKDSKDDQITQYVLLREAQRLYEDLGDLQKAIACVDELAANFDVDSIALKIKLLDDVVVKTPSDLALLTETAMSLIARQQRSSDYESAFQVIQVVQTHAGKMKDKALQKQMLDLKQENQERRAEYDAYRSSLTTLERTPNDKSANLVAGRYACLVAGDWKAGLASLLKAEGPLKSIAEKELSKPEEVAAMLELGDSWWSAAESEKGLTRTRMRREAGYWYRQAISSLSGIKKTAVEKKLAEIKGNSLREKVLGLVRATYAGVDFDKLVDIGIDAKINQNFGVGGVAPGLPIDNFSVRWTGVLRIPETADYAIVFDHDDGGRLWIDGKQVVDNWQAGVGHDQVDLKLTKGDHAIKVEYFEGGVFAGINLWWKSAAIQQEIIPPTAFFHDPADVPRSNQLDTSAP